MQTAIVGAPSGPGCCYLVCMGAGVATASITQTSIWASNIKHSPLLKLKLNFVVGKGGSTTPS